MSSEPSFEAIREELDVSFGYIQNDMKAICNGTETINYTLALLVAIACEMLAAARGERRKPETILAEILPQEWRPLAKKFFDAILNGLAHGFDTKHILVEGIPYQIYMQWYGTSPVEIVHSSVNTRLCVRPRILAGMICAQIDQLREYLRYDDVARKIWFDSTHRHKREIRLETKEENQTWKSLL